MCGGSFREGAVLLPQCAANESKVSDTDESPAGTDHQQATRCSGNRPPPISPSSSSSPSSMAAIDSGRFPPRGVVLRFSSSPEFPRGNFNGTVRSQAMMAGWGDIYDRSLSK